MIFMMYRHIFTKHFHFPVSTRCAVHYRDGASYEQAPHCDGAQWLAPGGPASGPQQAPHRDGAQWLASGGPASAILLDGSRMSVC